MSQCEPMEEDAVVTMGWKYPVVTRVGCFYPISHTHCICPKSDLKFILERLMYAFRLLSLHTVYYDAPSVRACCRSLEQVEFAVNIWECRNEPDFTVLEMQRISGDTIIYFRYVERIFSEISQKEVTVTDDEFSKTSMRATRDNMQVIMRSLPSPPDNIVQQTLDIVLNMLLSDRIDARYLGLESLVILTDTSKTVITMATDVAKALLLGSFDNSGETLPMGGQRIQKRIFHLAFFKKWPDSITAAAGELGFFDEGPHVHLALVAMANAIDLLQSSSPDLLSLVLDAASHMGGGNCLFIAMESYIQEAHNNPHAAYLAARILTSLYRSPSTRIGYELQLDAVRAAQQIGHYSHAALEMVTGQLLSALEA